MKAIFDRKRNGYLRYFIDLLTNHIAPHKSTKKWSILVWIIELHLVSSLYCDSLSYANSRNTTCHACPDNTARLLDNANTAAGPGSSLNDCVCEDGYYSAGGITGVECLSCPSGASCDGRSSTPRAKKGYWRAALTVSYSHQDKSWVSSSQEIATEHEMFYPCSPWYACSPTEMADFAQAEQVDTTITTSDVSYIYYGNRNGTTKCNGNRHGIRCEG